MDEDGAKMEAALLGGFSDKEKQQLRGYIARMTENIKTCPEDKV